MRNGFLGAIVALAAGVGLASAQVFPGGPLPGPNSGGYGPGEGRLPVNLPQLGPTDGDPGQGGPGGVPYPPPANWEGFDPNGPPGTAFRGPEAPYVWFGAEYLMWFSKAASFNAPLASTSAPINGGVLGTPDSHILYGNRDVQFNLTSGFRVTGGMFFDPERRLGFELSGFVLEKRNSTFSIQSQDGGTPLIARPYFDTNSGTNAALLVSAPGIATGNINVVTSTRTWGAEGNGVLNLYRSSPSDYNGYSLSLLGGFRYLDLKEAVNIQSDSNLFPGAAITFANQSFTAAQASSSTSSVINPGVFPTTTTTTSNTTSAVNYHVIDQFNAHNEFYGGNLGLYQEFRSGRWSLGVKSKVALGLMHEMVDVNGNSVLTQTLTTNSNSVTVDPRFINSNTTTQSTSSTSGRQGAIGGLYALSDQIGRYRRDVFAVVPEGTLNLGYQITPGISGFIGYNVIYMNRVARAAPLVTGNANSALLPLSPNFGASTIAPPVDVFKETDFWVQGINFGLNFRY